MGIISLNSLKGGTGKTSAAINLAAIWNEKQKTLLVDLDPQANAGTGLGIVRPSVSITDVLIGQCEAQEAIIATPYVDVLPSDISLAQLDGEDLGGGNRLKQIIRPLQDEYDLIVIDCPPSLGLLSVSALLAADAVIAPTMPSVYDYDGLDKLIVETIPEIRRAGLNPGLKMLGIFYSNANTRTKLFKTVDEYMQEQYDGLLFKTIIRPAVKVGEAALFGKPVMAYHRAAAKDYFTLSREVLKRWQKA